jgi:hypothetical protein
MSSTSEMVCLGAGAAALALLVCRRPSAAMYREGSECSAYRAEVVDEDVSARVVSKATEGSLSEVQEEVEDWIKEVNSRDSLKGDGESAATGTKLTLPPPTNRMGEIETSMNHRSVGGGNANRDIVEYHTNGQVGSALPPKDHAGAPRALPLHS